MRREIFFLDNPDQHVDHFRTAAQTLSGPQLQEEQSVEQFFALFRAQILGCIATYSRGDKLADVKTAFAQVQKSLSSLGSAGGQPLDLNDAETYHLVLWTLSIGLLLGLDAADLDALTRQLNAAGQDALLDHLIKIAQPEMVPATTLLHPARYASLLEAITGGQADRPEKVKQFLLSYYDTGKGLSWHDSHLRQEMAFFGYWSFELAAIVKAFHISDGTFADNIFYPRDFVHQRIFRTWLDGVEGERDRKEKASTVQEDEMKTAVDMLGEYFTKGAGAASTQPGGSLDMLSKLTKVSPEEMEEDPKMAQSLVSELLRSVIDASADLGKSLDSDKVSPEMRQLIESFLGKEGNFKDSPADISKIFGDLPPEVQKDIEAAPGTRNTEVLKAHYAKISNQLSETLEKEKVDQLTFLEGLEKLAADLGVLKPALSQTETEAMKNRFIDELRETRKGRSLENFDVRSLWPKKDGGES